MQLMLRATLCPPDPAARLGQDAQSSQLLRNEEQEHLAHPPPLGGCSAEKVTSSHREEGRSRAATRTGPRWGHAIRAGAFPFPAGDSVHSDCSKHTHSAYLGVPHTYIRPFFP